MKIKAGAGYCLINNSKIRLRKDEDNNVYCMYKGRRYIFKKPPPNNRIVTVEAIRARKLKKPNSYRTKARNSRRNRRSKRRPRSVFMKRRSRIKSRNYKRKTRSNRRLTKAECKKKVES